MTERTEKEYNKFIESTCWYRHAGEYNASELAYLVLGLSGETGEFADAFKKIIREVGFDDDQLFEQFMGEHGGHQKLVDELGDVLWYLTRLCQYLSINMEWLMLSNTHKLHSRLIEKGIIKEEDLPWPFTDPMKSKNNVQNQLDIFKYLTGKVGK